MFTPARRRSCTVVCFITRKERGPRGAESTAGGGESQNGRARPFLAGTAERKREGRQSVQGDRRGAWRGDTPSEERGSYPPEDNVTDCVPDAAHVAEVATTTRRQARVTSKYRRLGESSCDLRQTRQCQAAELRLLMDLGIAETSEARSSSRTSPFDRLGESSCDLRERCDAKRPNCAFSSFDLGDSRAATTRRDAKLPNVVYSVATKEAGCQAAELLRLVDRLGWQHFRQRGASSTW